MNNKKSKNSMFIVFTGIIIAVCRFILGNIETATSDDSHILIVMAVVNYIALGFVLLFLYNDFCNICKENVNMRGLDSTLKKRCNLIIFICSFILLFLYLLFGILYVLVFKSSDLNDVLSIIALAISIATNGLLEEYKNSYYRFIVKISKLSLNKKKKQKDSAK